MSLTTRVSLFFLGALALVLVAFSIGVYKLAGLFFRQVAEERLLTTFHALAASAEIEPDGVEWNPVEHHLAASRFSGFEPIHWLVTTGDGTVIDSSPAASRIMGFAEDLHAVADGSIETRQSQDGEFWWIVRQRLTTPESKDQATFIPDDSDDVTEYPELVVTAGISIASTQASVHRLAAWIVSLAIGVWCVAAIVGRWFCRRALSPVTRMAAATRMISAVTPGASLPISSSGDELEELGRSFNSLLNRLHDSFERQRQFTSEASHQLRTPIAVLQGQIEVALRRDRSPDEHRRVLTELDRQSRRLGEIVDSLLFLARADSDAIVDLLTPLNLAPWLTEHLRNSGAVERRDDFVLEEFSDEPEEVMALQPLLGQLVDNLVENAFRYSVSGQRVSVRLRRLSQQVHLLVEDQGAGIPAEDLPHVFEPFYRSGNARKTHSEGLGLGLAVARRIAHVFGAEIHVRSKMGVGTTMVVIFPLANFPTGMRTPGAEHVMQTIHGSGPSSAGSDSELNVPS